MHETVKAIVLAAGRGTRMGTDMPKQFLEVNGYPILYYTLKAFEEFEAVSEVVLVCSGGDIEYCKREIAEKYHLRKVKHIVPGGAERNDSVLEGLRCCGMCDYVMIHDGARPMVDEALLNRSLSAVREHKAVICAMPVKDTIKKIDKDGKVLETPDRAQLYQVQTPQTFQYDIIREAYEKMAEDIVRKVTDDAMVLEQYGSLPVYYAEGSYRNIKVTTPEDMLILRAFLADK